MEFSGLFCLVFQRSYGKVGLRIFFMDPMLLGQFLCIIIQLINRTLCVVFIIVHHKGRHRIACYCNFVSLFLQRKVSHSTQKIFQTGLIADKVSQRIVNQRFFSVRFFYQLIAF